MRTSILTLLASASSVIAQSTTTNNNLSGQTTLSLPLVTPGYAGSVVGADACGTTIAVACTASVCPYPNPEVTFTMQSDKRVAEYSTAVDGVAGTASISCTFSGPATAVTKAVCHEYLYASGGGHSASTSTSVTVTSGITYNAVVITANAQALTSATGVCSTSSGAVAAGPTAAVKDVYKVLVPVGAALLALA